MAKTAEELAKIPKKVQCAHCPWRTDVKPDKDIPGGYSKDKHCALKKTIVEPGTFSVGRGLHVMACHESPIGGERPCVGWAMHQLGRGNNIALRMAAMCGDERFINLETVGEQHERFEDTIPGGGQDDVLDEAIDSERDDGDREE